MRNSSKASITASEFRENYMKSKAARAQPDAETPLQENKRTKTMNVNQWLSQNGSLVIETFRHIEADAESQGIPTDNVKSVIQDLEEHNASKTLNIHKLNWALKKLDIKMKDVDRHLLESSNNPDIKPASSFIFTKDDDALQVKGEYGPALLNAIARASRDVIDQQKNQLTENDNLTNADPIPTAKRFMDRVVARPSNFSFSMNSNAHAPQSFTARVGQGVNDADVDLAPATPMEKIERAILHADNFARKDVRTDVSLEKVNHTRRIRSSELEGISQATLTGDMVKDEHFAPKFTTDSTYRVTVEIFKPGNHHVVDQKNSIELGFKSDSDAEDFTKLAVDHLMMKAGQPNYGANTAIQSIRDLHRDIAQDKGVV